MIQICSWSALSSISQELSRKRNWKEVFLCAFRTSETGFPSTQVKSMPLNIVIFDIDMPLAKIACVIAGILVMVIHCFSNQERTWTAFRRFLINLQEQCTCQPNPQPLADPRLLANHQQRGIIHYSVLKISNIFMDNFHDFIRFTQAPGIVIVNQMVYI